MTTVTLRRRHDEDHLGAAVRVVGRAGAPAARDAITMPAAFGALVQAELEIMMLAGPVISDAGSWTFLTRPANTRSAAVPTDLLPLGVRVGSTIERPGPGDREPAIWSAVIGASRRVAERARRTAA